MTSAQKKIMQSFGRALRRARENAGYAKAQHVADLLGIEPHTYRAYERGTNPPNLVTLTRICGLLNVTPNDLLPEAAALGSKRASPQGPQA